MYALCRGIRSLHFFINIFVTFIYFIMDSPARLYGLTCYICSEKETTRSASKRLITCDGFCGRQFHPQCLKVPVEVIEFCKTYEDYLEFKCKDCRRTTTAHAIRAIDNAVRDLKSAIDYQGQNVKSSIAEDVLNLIQCNDCSTKTFNEISIQCDMDDTPVLLTQDEEIPIPQAFELDSSGEWKMVRNKKVWKKWTDNTHKTPKMDPKVPRKPKKNRNLQRSRNPIPFSNPRLDGNLGAWNSGPPAAVFHPNSFQNRSPPDVYVPNSFGNHSSLRRRRKSVKISGLSPDTSEFVLSTYIYNSFNIHDVDVKSLTPRNLRFPANYSSFKVTVPENDANLLLNHRQWGFGTRVEEFRENTSQPVGFRTRRFNNHH